MEFMGFHIVDIVIVTLVAFLAIKGLVNGFTKELLNFITIVAGIFLAARYNTTVVQLINEQKLVPQIPDDFAKIVGFILILFAVWLVIGVISSIISKLTAGPTGFISRLFGYILSAARYVFIFSLIVFGISQSDFFKESATKFKTETQLFEPMSQFGKQILNVDLNETFSTDTNVTLVDKIVAVTTVDKNTTTINTKESNLTSNENTTADTNVTTTKTSEDVVTETNASK